MENAYQKCLAEVRHIVDSERARATRVDCLLLAADKDQLQLQCQQTETQVAQLLAGESDTQQQLRDAQDEISSLQSSLRESAKTIEELEVRGDLMALLDDLCLAVRGSNEANRMNSMRNARNWLSTKTRSQTNAVLQNSFRVCKRRRSV